jgi:hypothetical protein
MVLGVNREQFSMRAAILWSTVPKDGKALILKSVFCAQCRGQAEMVDFTGKEKKGDLILTGSCAKCGHKVVRVVETSELPTQNN